MNHSNTTSITLPTVRLVLGVIAILLSLLFSIQFVSQGATGATIISAVLFCLITEFAKVAFTHDCLFYWETNQGSKALFSVLLVMILFALSISAAVFVLSISPAKNNATIAQFDERRGMLERNLDDKKAELAKCNPNHVSKCVTPRTAELTQMQTELNTFLTQADNAKIIEAKANDEFWKKAADYLGSDSNSLQFNFNIARAVLLDVIGLILISQYTANKSRMAAIHVRAERVIHQTPDDDKSELLHQIELLKLELAKKEQTH